jgi:hypothetical protein
MRGDMTKKFKHYIIKKDNSIGFPFRDVIISLVVGMVVFLLFFWLIKNYI